MIVFFTTVTLSSYFKVERRVLPPLSAVVASPVWWSSSTSRFPCHFQRPFGYIAVGFHLPVQVDSSPGDIEVGYTELWIHCGEGEGLDSFSSFLLRSFVQNVRVWL
jgi:hypothetical protein